MNENENENTASSVLQEGSVEKSPFLHSPFLRSLFHRRISGNGDGGTITITSPSSSIGGGGGCVSGGSSVCSNRSQMTASSSSRFPRFRKGKQRLVAAVDESFLPKLKLVMDASTPPTSNTNTSNTNTTTTTATSRKQKKKSHRLLHAVPPPRMRLNEGIFIHGSDNEQDHKQRVEQLLKVMGGTFGADGLARAGFEFRNMRCQDHTHSSSNNTGTTSRSDAPAGGPVPAVAMMGNVHGGNEAFLEEKKTDDQSIMELMARGVDFKACEDDPISTEPFVGTKNELEPEKTLQTEQQQETIKEPSSITTNTKKSATTAQDQDQSSLPQENSNNNGSDNGNNNENNNGSDKDAPNCSHCITRLYHIESNTLITEENRRSFIVDGRLYEEIARVCQEHAQHLMKQEGQLEWVTICNQRDLPPIRALVHSKHHLASGANDNNTSSTGNSDTGNGTSNDSDSGNSSVDPKPTLLITTGKGKVRAGIFSRRHIMTSGIEPSTALPMVREAARRNINVTILDPNARGDQLGMDTYEKSLGVLFGHWEDTNHERHHQKHELYVLAHSMSGAQFVRYLLDRAHYYLPCIRAVAFTDSTHSIQWAKHNTSLKHLLESSACVYVKSANENRDNDWQRHKPGDVVKTDSFWTHRFGGVRTLWAGTKEHSLTNWTAHTNIWDHYDRHLRAAGPMDFSGRGACSSMNETSALEEEKYELPRG